MHALYRSPSKNVSRPRNHSQRREICFNVFPTGVARCLRQESHESRLQHHRPRRPSFWIDLWQQSYVAHLKTLIKVIGYDPELPNPVILKMKRPYDHCSERVALGTVQVFGSARNGSHPDGNTMVSDLLRTRSVN